MRVIVIPDCHLKPWMFENAAEIIRDGKADRAVCLMDLPDDFGKDDKKIYVDTYDAAINFTKKFPETLWCYGNHDLSYVWGKPESGYHPGFRELVYSKIEELRKTLPKKRQLAYIHKIDNVLFMHGGLTQSFVRLSVTHSHQNRITSVIKEINEMGSGFMWSDGSPIWYRPQFAPDESVERLYRGGEYLQVVGHTPVEDVVFEGGVLSCDTFSTYRDGRPYGSEKFCIVDTQTKAYETVTGRKSN